MRKIEADFRQNALSSLLVLRLIPLFPFFVVNVVPALLGVRPGTYARGTVVGIIPGAFVCATVGAGWGSVFDRMEAVSLTGILTPEIIAALVGLARVGAASSPTRRFAPVGVDPRSPSCRNRLDRRRRVA